jgi:hypothetical protein
MRIALPAADEEDGEEFTTEATEEAENWERESCTVKGGGGG